MTSENLTIRKFAIIKLYISSYNKSKPKNREEKYDIVFVACFFYHAASRRR